LGLFRCAEPPITPLHDEDETMTTISKHRLRTKRHPRSIGTSPRALRDAAEAIRECLCRHARVAA
jgi:hypothetical protein